MLPPPVTHAGETSGSHSEGECFRVRFRHRRRADSASGPLAPGELSVQTNLVCLVCLVGLVCLVSLVYLVSLVQSNKRNKPNRPDKPNQPDRPNGPDGPARIPVSSTSKRTFGWRARREQCDHLLSSWRSTLFRSAAARRRHFTSATSSRRRSSGSGATRSND